jgi:predicted metalloprotease with PDZ domain
MAGIVILGCLPGSPADQVGLEYGDVLLSVNGEAMRTIADFLRVRAETSDFLEIVVQRANRVLELVVDLRQARRRTTAELVAQLTQLTPQHLHQQAQRSSLLPGSDTDPDGEGGAN